MMTEKQIYTVGIHEAAHFVAADFFKIPAYPRVFPDGERFPGSATTLAGVCELMEPVSKFQRATVCWAGILAECLLVERPAFAPPFPPSGRDLRLWHSAMIHQLRKLSPGDYAGIAKGFRQSLKACRKAFEIVSRNKATIKRIAKGVAAAVKNQSAPADVFSLKIEPVKPLELPAPMTETFEASPSLPGNVEVLRKFLSQMKPDDPQRSQFQEMLARLERDKRLSDEIYAIPG
jgi:hypothetical protein